MFEYFIFNGMENKAYGVICVNYEKAISNELVIDPSELQTQTISSQNRFTILSKNLNSPITFDIQLMKMDYSYFTPLDQEAIVNWLCKDNYDKLYINKDGYEDIYFNAIFTTPKLIDDVILQFTVSLDSTFGKTDISKDFIITSNNEQIHLGVKGQENQITYPVITVTGCTGDLKIVTSNNKSQTTTIITDCSSAETIIIDSYLCTLRTTDINHDIYNCFNKKWISLLNGETNYFTIGSPCNLSISYTQQRMVAIG